jgi:hypothetical protein
MDPIVKVLAHHEVIDLVAGEPDLEDIFLGFYEGQRKGPDDVA